MSCKDISLILLSTPKIQHKYQPTTSPAHRNLPCPPYRSLATVQPYTQLPPTKKPYHQLRPQSLNIDTAYIRQYCAPQLRLFKGLFNSILLISYIYTNKYYILIPLQTGIRVCKPPHLTHAPFETETKLETSRPKTQSGEDRREAKWQSTHGSISMRID